LPAATIYSKAVEWFSLSNAEASNSRHFSEELARLNLSYCMGKWINPVLAGIKALSATRQRDPDTN
jgi:hypothetical protein